MSLRGLGPDSDLTVDAGGYRTVRMKKIFFLIVKISVYLITYFYTQRPEFTPTLHGKLLVDTIYFIMHIDF